MVVIPVYNEQGALKQLVDAWLRVLDTMAVNARLLLINDGSHDGSWDLLEQLSSANSRLMIRNKQNEGHGPTILCGYREAVKQAEWVFQTDSDLEVHPDDFPALWKHRHEADVILGVRTGRKAPWLRKGITRILGIVLRMGYRVRFQDPNCPFRLLRVSAIQAVVEKIPSDTFAPNPVIAALAVRAGAPWLEIPVGYRPRETGEVSIQRIKLLRAAFRALIETVALRTLMKEKVK